MAIFAFAKRLPTFATLVSDDSYLNGWMTGMALLHREKCNHMQ